MKSVDYTENVERKVMIDSNGVLRRALYALSVSVGRGLRYSNLCTGNRDVIRHDIETTIRPRSVH